MIIKVFLRSFSALSCTALYFSFLSCLYHLSLIFLSAFPPLSHSPLSILLISQPSLRLALSQLSHGSFSDLFQIFLSSFSDLSQIILGNLMIGIDEIHSSFDKALLCDRAIYTDAIASKNSVKHRHIINLSAKNRSLMNSNSVEITRNRTLNISLMTSLNLQTNRKEKPFKCSRDVFLT